VTPGPERCSRDAGRPVAWTAEIIVADEPYFLDPEDATSLAWLLRTVEIPDAPDLETAALTAAVIVEDAAQASGPAPPDAHRRGGAGRPHGSREAARTAGLSPRLSRLHLALQVKHG
jgi:hypothetical protein